jgi:hypothetical protein
LLLLISCTYADLEYYENLGCNIHKASDFLEFKLNQENMKGKEIIGYICPQDLFGETIKKGQIYTKIQGGYGPQNIPVARFELPKEIVETWEPVYAQEQHKIGDWVNVVNPGGCYTSHSEAPSKVKDGEIYNAGIIINPGLYKILRFDSWSNGTKIVIVKSDNLVYFLTYQDYYLNYIKPASTEEIKNHLINEAKTRGFNTYVKFTAVRDVVRGDKTPSGLCKFEEKTNGECGSCFIYDETKDCLITYGCGVYVVYENGEWATLKSQKEVVTLYCDSGSFELEVSEKGIYFRPEDVYLNITCLENFLEAVNNTHLVVAKDNKSGIYLFCTSKIDMGCKKNVPIEYLKKVVDLYNKLQND